MTNENNENIYKPNLDTGIICIDCLKGHLISGENNIATCDHCCMKFVITAPNHYKYLGE